MDNSHLNLPEVFHQDPCFIPREINENVTFSCNGKETDKNNSPFIWIHTKKLMGSVMGWDPSSIETSWKSVQ